MSTFIFNKHCKLNRQPDEPNGLCKLYTISFFKLDLLWLEAHVKQAGTRGMLGHASVKNSTKSSFNNLIVPTTYVITAKPDSTIR